MRHDKILFLHPVLRHGGFDYSQECHFNMTINESKRTAEGVVQILATLDLASKTLCELLETQRAKFLIMMQCAKTYYRRVDLFDTTKVTLKIPAGDLAGILRLTPYVVASKDLDWLDSDEHEDEIRKIRNSGKIPRGSVLAVSASYEIEMDEIGTIKSAIKMQRNNNVKEGMYTIDLIGDFVVIELGPKTYADVVQMRAHLRELLYPSIYQAAIEHALRKMTDYPDSRWAKALQKTIDEQKIGDKVKENPNYCAQIILGDPLKQMIRRCERGMPDVY